MGLFCLPKPASRFGPPPPPSIRFFSLLRFGLRYAPACAPKPEKSELQNAAYTGRENSSSVFNTGCSARENSSGVSNTGFSTRGDSCNVPIPAAPSPLRANKDAIRSVAERHSLPDAARRGERGAFGNPQPSRSETIEANAEKARHNLHLTRSGKSRDCESKMDLWAEEGRSNPQGASGGSHQSEIRNRLNRAGCARQFRAD